LALFIISFIISETIPASLLAADRCFFPLKNAFQKKVKQVLCHEKSKNTPRIHRKVFKDKAFICIDNSTKVKQHLTAERG